MSGRRPGAGDPDLWDGPTVEDISLEQLLGMMADRGADRVYVKRLAPNDNSKNQIYLGSALNALPSTSIEALPPDLRGQRFVAWLNLSWLSPAGEESPAPGAKLILYPQYPEVRLSGFLRSSRLAPNELLASRVVGRVLFLAVTSTGRILAFAAPFLSRLRREIEALGETAKVGPLIEIPLRGAAPVADPRADLLQALRAINGKGWILSQKFPCGATKVPCAARNCGGLTLEAELDICINPIAEPDYLGWEVKQFGVRRLGLMTAKSPVTIMTPNPDSGPYADKGVEWVIRNFGHPNKDGIPDRFDFNGRHLADLTNAGTKLKLTLAGYDSTLGLTDATGGIELLSDVGELIGRWSFAALLKHWERKHDRAVYVPSVLQTTPLAYAYGPTVFLGEGTHFALFIKALANRQVFWDPGSNLTSMSVKPKAHGRSQFRVASKHLGVLYKRLAPVDVYA